MFHFKQFTIQQDRTPMKVGTDGVLLGAWAEVDKAGHLLDIGTGTGLIALMAAQRNPTARIDAIEIEPAACGQARENILATPWHSRIQLVQTALQDYFPTIQYDCIVCNPPFFNHSTPTPDKGRTLARHSDSLPHPELIRHVARLLKKDGQFSVILPVPEGLDMIRNAIAYQLHPVHLTEVLPNPGKSPKRYLIAFRFNPTTPLIKDQLVIEFSRHQYSPEYIRLTKAFYLKIDRPNE